jgi:PAS domain-containing protein
MAQKPTSQAQLLAENAELRARLETAEATLSEILSGEADALVIPGLINAQLFTLHGVDQAYRLLIENMSEGALTLSSDGLVLYANLRFAEMVRAPVEKNGRHRHLHSLCARRPTGPTDTAAKGCAR